MARHSGEDSASRQNPQADRLATLPMAMMRRELGSFPRATAGRFVWYKIGFSMMIARPSGSVARSLPTFP
jgi:hypothetical protein